jgi:hypothetical protein
MYVELWCEEQFNQLALGPPDFSQQELVSPLLISSVVELDLVCALALLLCLQLCHFMFLSLSSCRRILVCWLLHLLT